jgi:hypothetical protein
MAVRHASYKSSAVPSTKHFFTVAADEHHLALDDPNELVFGSVPVALASPLPRWEAREVYPELR